MKRIDEYWKSVGKMKDESRQLKYLQLFALVKCVLFISQGNSIPEWGFSINKYLLSIHGTSTSNETIIALRLVKGHLILIGGYMKFSINRDLILSVKTARQKYQQDQEAKRLLKEKESERIKLADEMKEENKSLEEKLSNVEADTKIKESSTSVAEESIQEGSEKLQNQLKQSKISLNEIQKAQSMIDMGLSHKPCLSTELEELQKEKAKLLKKQ